MFTESAGNKLSRRTLLGAGAAAALAVGASASNLPTAVAAGPKSADWAALAKQLDGRLLRPGQDAYYSALKTFDPRRDVQRPAGIVQAAGAGDVADALRFAVKFDLKPRPRSGGHSYVGASTGNGVLVVDCSRMTNIHYHSDKTVTISPGVRLGDLHDVLDRHGRTIPTGTCPTVGAAGLTLGGGIGVEDRLYGLTCDALTGATVIGPDGRTYQCSKDEHSDLFWALRGGGGGNFGVVTRLSYRSYPALPGEIFRLSWPSDDAHRVLTGWQHRLLGGMPKHAWANLHLDSSGGSVHPSITGVCWDSSATAEIKQLTSAIGRSPSGKQIWHESHAGAMSWFAGGSAGRKRQSWSAGSDIVGHKLYGSRADAIIRAVGSWNGSGSVAAIFDPFGGAMSPPSASATAFRWRDAIADVQWYVGLGSTSRANLDRAAAWLKRCHSAIGSASIGAYVNYLEPGRTHVSDYYGGNYQRLVAINKKYDPHNVFDSRYSLPG
ncbi:FAD-binding oxidoreductase [Microlunatus elymi]|nr:FAD-binding oxidoreductase [Microlunatus elymi]